jgi:hypothetical protein
MSKAITISGEEIMTELEKAELLQQALDEFDAWRKRYAEFPEFNSLIEVIDETILRYGEIKDDSIEPSQERH